MKKLIFCALAILAAVWFYTQRQVNTQETWGIEEPKELFVSTTVPAFNGAKMEIEDPFGKKSVGSFPLQAPTYISGGEPFVYSDILLPNPGDMNDGFTVRVSGRTEEGGYTALFQVPKGAEIIRGQMRAILTVSLNCKATLILANIELNEGSYIEDPMADFHAIGGCPKE